MHLPIDEIPLFRGSDIWIWIVNNFSWEGGIKLVTSILAWNKRGHYVTSPQGVVIPRENVTRGWEVVSRSCHNRSCQYMLFNINPPVGSF